MLLPRAIAPNPRCRLGFHQRTLLGSCLVAQEACKIRNRGKQGSVPACILAAASQPGSDLGTGVGQRFGAQSLAWQQKAAPKAKKSSGRRSGRLGFNENKTREDGRSALQVSECQG